MSASNQQTLAESGATDRPPILEKGNYIPWESRFRRFLENKAYYELPTRDLSRPLLATPLTTLPPSVPLLDLLISSSP
ncbi:hypothetical protein Tco_1194283 [Tanacetum coccineum]